MRTTADQTAVANRYTRFIPMTSLMCSSSTRNLSPTRSHSYSRPS